VNDVILSLPSRRQVIHRPVVPDREGLPWCVSVRAVIYSLVHFFNILEYRLGAVVKGDILSSPEMKKVVHVLDGCLHATVHKCRELEAEACTERIPMRNIISGRGRCVVGKEIPVLCARKC
jgi:hypothetical protein